MHKYTKIVLGLVVLGAVIAIIFRPTGKLMGERPGADYLAAYEEAKAQGIPVFMEFYGDN